MSEAQVDQLRFLSRQSQFALTMAFCTFFSFACAEMAFAFLSNSLALLGDAAAMCCDAFSYIGNLIAVRHQSSSRRDGLKHSQLVIIGPFLSALTLIGVMIYVFIDALQELFSSDDDDVKLTVVLAFGISNLFLDFANLACFWAFPEAYRAILTFTDPESLEADGGLNIRSALTHVLADTYRSVAVIVSAGSAMLFKGVSPSKADAIGALAVQLPIVGMCFQMAFAVYRRFFPLLTADDDDSLQQSRQEPFLAADDSGAGLA